MNNYFVVATAKHTLNLRGKQYKIGEPVPTELTEKEYNFYKDALNVESVKEVFELEETGKFEFHPSDKYPVQVGNQEELKKAFEKALKENEELKAKLAKAEKNSVGDNFYTSAPDETEVKPKRPYTKKVKEDV